MKYRRIVSGEPCFGQSQQDFISENEAVAQAILTRLSLFEGEWWEDQNEGLPLWTQIMGYAGTNKSRVTAVITKRIRDTKLEDTSLVKNVSDVSGVYDAETRTYTYTATVQTIYGTIEVTLAR